VVSYNGASGPFSPNLWPLLSPIFFILEATTYGRLMFRS
jgi:hypothetical protein